MAVLSFFIFLFCRYNYILQASGWSKLLRVVTYHDMLHTAGIGVDDMFVIMGALVNLEPEEQEYDVPRKVGDVLKHAGVSITVTSITDFVAFGIGATTVSGCVAGEGPAGSVVGWISECMDLYESDCVGDSKGR